VDHAANAPNHFLVRRARFELQTRFVERLQQLRGALKKESAKFVVAIVGLTAHVFASMR
jgi:hypothetical protein